MKRAFSAVVVAATLSLSTLTSGAVTFEEGNWATAKVGQSCYVFSQRAARDTSGTLVFSFGPKGVNPSFSYEYAPWPGDEGAPWDTDDSVLLEVDGKELWLGEEMFAYDYANGYAVGLTTGFVAEMIASLTAAQQTVSVNFDRVAKGEVWNYGKFSTDGFNSALTKAGEICGFDPKSLPSS